MMKSSNPALGKKTFENNGSWVATNPNDVMTIDGTVNKTGFLLLLIIASATFTWRSVMVQTELGPMVDVPPYFWASLIVALLLSLIIIFKKTTAPVLAPVYALCEGVVLGAISATFEHKYPGIVVQALVGTFGTLAALLLAYKSRLIPVTQNFRLGVAAATGGIALLYLISLILGMFGISIPYLHDSSPIGIAISVGVCIVAALNLVMDFDFIESGVDAQAPKYMEWYSAFGLVVTLVWLYLEILRLLSKARDR